jgi:hypothetical protein
MRTPISAGRPGRVQNGRFRMRYVNKRTLAQRKVRSVDRRSGRASGRPSPAWMNFTDRPSRSPWHGLVPQRPILRCQPSAWRVVMGGV